METKFHVIPPTAASGTRQKLERGYAPKFHSSIAIFRHPFLNAEALLTPGGSDADLIDGTARFTIRFAEKAVREIPRYSH